MPQITRDEIPLTDEPKLRALIESLRLTKLKRKLAKRQIPALAKKDSLPSWAPFDGPEELSRDAREKHAAYVEAMKRLGAHRLAERAKFTPPAFPSVPEPPRFLRDYFHDCVPRRVWRNGESISVRVSFGKGVLQRVVISGLKNEKEANAVWLEATFHRASGETLEHVAERVVSDTEREAREYHRSFVSHLRHVRDYFTWRDGEAIPSEGRWLSIEKSGLKPEDIELLRQVYTRLRHRSSKVPYGGWYPALQIEDESCPTCGGAKAKPEPIKSLKKAREKVKQHSGEFANAGFDIWVAECLQTKTDKWTRSRDPLYFHYKAWIRNGGHGQNMGEKAEARATALSEVKWGMLMRRRFPDAWKQDKRSILYRVALKRGA